MKPLQGIFIDFYGTIAGGDRDAVERICCHLATTHRLDVSPRDLAAAWGRRFFEKIDRSNPKNFANLIECERESLRQLMEGYIPGFDPEPAITQMRDYLQAPPLHTEVRHVLASLTIPVVVLSNVDRQDLDRAIAHHQLTFADTITSEEARAYKPNPAVFHYALRRTGWSADRVFHVGDSLHSDVAGAAAANITSVWIRRNDRISDIGKALPDYTFPDLRPLIQITENL